MSDIFYSMSIPYKRNREVYWAAGLFEGEGTISCSEKLRGKVSMEMTDRDVLERFAAAVGAGKVSGPRLRGPERKPIYLWAVYSIDEWSGVIRLLYPLLGPRRQQQADKLLALRRIRRPVHRLVLGGKCRNGHLLNTETLYVNPKRRYKHCKPCRSQGIS